MTKNKDKKGKESTIGKIIYGFLLFMPLIAIGSTILYTSFNKNAYRSYSDEYIESYSPVSSQNQITANNTYQIIYDETIAGGQSPYFTISDTNLYELLDIENRIINQVLIVNEQNYSRINLIFTDSTTQRIDNWNLQFKSFYFTLTNTNYNATLNLNRCKLYQIVWNTRKISDSFYYAIDKVEKSNLFNWAKNSIVYTTLVATCNELSITNTFIPMLLAYWLIISIIYILYDIALMMLIIFHHKVHCLQDSI